MKILNIEFKAKSDHIDLLEEKLLRLSPKFIGEDHQIDTYFNVPQGRLKLREGNIENSLIYYIREDTSGSKQSDGVLYRHDPAPALKELLVKVHGIKVVVDKRRRIYFIDNVKFHFDRVAQLGTFVEVEAIDREGDIGVEHLQRQCDYYAAFFEINSEDYMEHSYSDMLLNL